MPVERLLCLCVFELIEQENNHQGNVLLRLIRASNLDNPGGKLIQIHLGDQILC